MDVVTELLARIGEFFVIGHFEVFDSLSIPNMTFMGGDPHVVLVSLKDEPRRLILDQDFGWLWYNAEEGPVE